MCRGRAAHLPTCRLIVRTLRSTRLDHAARPLGGAACDLRLVLGARHHCATLAIPGGPTLPLYLPEAAGPMLPLLERFEARILVEPHPPQEADQSGVTLVALALARTVPMA